MVPSLTCGGPVLLGQGVREVFDPQVVIVTWWVGRDSKETGQVKPPGVVTRPEGESGGGRQTCTWSSCTDHQQAPAGEGAGERSRGRPQVWGEGAKDPEGFVFCID